MDSGTWSGWPGTDRSSGKRRRTATMYAKVSSMATVQYVRARECCRGGRGRRGAAPGRLRAGRGGAGACQQRGGVNGCVRVPLQIGEESKGEEVDKVGFDSGVGDGLLIHQRAAGCLTARQSAGGRRTRHGLSASGERLGKRPTRVGPYAL